MAARTGGQADYLYPNKDVPVPLPEDFYKVWLAGGSSAPQTQSSVPQQAQVNSTATEKIVDQLIKENQDLIEKEALKRAAAASLNVNTAQYTNLIPLSFDQDELIRQEEEKRQKQRERMSKKLYSNMS